MMQLKYIKENKTLYIISLVIFLLIYLSVFNSLYGYFIDEFYYIACANRPAFGYVDHPPLAPFILTIFQGIFGNSVYAIRIIPALTASVTVFMTGILARETNGGKTAQAIAAISAASIPVLITFAGFYSMNIFEPLITVFVFYFLLKILKENSLKYWITVGVLTGLGIMNKHTFLLIALFIVFAILLTANRRILFNRYFLYAIVITFIIVLPNIIWQVINGFPTLEFYRNISFDKNVFTPPLKFLIGQILFMSPTVFIVWSAGLFYFLFNKKYKVYRIIPVFFIIAFLFFMFTGTSRPDRILFAYPILIPAGAVFWENILLKFNRKWLVYIFNFVVASFLFISIPVSLPYFNYESVKEYTAYIGLDTELEKGKKPPLPQILADRIGWEEKVEMVGSAFNTLLPGEKRESIIAGNNYGQAGALELYGRKFGFPIVAGGHNNYYLWSKGKLKGNILLQLGDDGNFEGLKSVFDSVYIFPAIYKSEYVSFHENRLKVFICRGPKINPERMLENGKNYH